MLLARTRVVGTLLALGLGALAVAPAQAQDGGERPVAYINADTGKDTENPGVAESSECETPVQSDTAPLGDEGSGSGNVHVDACLFSGSERVDTQAAFEVTGVGVISGCPDPDKDGPKTSNKVGSTCLHSGFEADNSEYHVRVVSASAGVQTVRFCADPERNGCGDAASVSSVQITWGAPAGGVAAGGATGAATGSSSIAVIALLGAAAALAAGTAVAASRR